MIKFSHSNLCCEWIRMRRSQSALEYLMTYGWSILIIVIVAVVLYGMGVFNPRASFSSSISGFSGLGSVTAQCIGGQGLSVQLGDTLPATINVTGINVTDSITGQSFSVNPYLIIPQGSFNLFYVPSVCPVPNEPFSARVTVTYTEPGQTFPGPYFISGSVSGRSVSSGISGSPSLTAAVPIELTNTQSSATHSPFQQMLNVTSFSYKSYEASNLQNIEFFYPNGTVIPSWLESGNSYTSNSTIYWLKLGSIPSGSSKTVYMGFASTSSNLLNGINIGEAPQLSSTYGEYDDGASIFTYYQKFGGLSSLPVNWNTYGSVSINFDAAYTVIHNVADSNEGAGVYIPAADISIGSFPFVFDFYGNIYQTLNTGNDAGIIDAAPSISPWSNFAYMLSSPNYYNRVDNQVIGCNNGCYFDTEYSSSNSTMLWTLEVPSSSAATFFANYSHSFTVTGMTSESLSNFIFDSENQTGISGTTGPITIYWFRVRAYPPNGVMPSATYEKLI